MYEAGANAFEDRRVRAAACGQARTAPSPRTFPFSWRHVVPASLASVPPVSRPFRRSAYPFAMRLIRECSRNGTPAVVRAHAHAASISTPRQQLPQAAPAADSATAIYCEMTPSNMPFVQCSTSHVKWPCGYPHRAHSCGSATQALLAECVIPEGTNLKFAVSEMAFVRHCARRDAYCSDMNANWTQYRPLTIGHQVCALCPLPRRQCAGR